MKKNIYFPFLFLSSISWAQSNTVSAGSSVSTSNGSLSVSVGQVAYVSASDPGGSINPGNQQTYEISVTGKSELPGISLSLTVYPNPTTDFLTLKVENQSFEKWSYQLTDAAGKLLSERPVLSETTLVDFKDLASGSYILSVYQAKKQVNSFKILKK